MALEWFGHQEAGLFGLLLQVERDLSKNQGAKLYCKVYIQAKWDTYPSQGYLQVSTHLYTWVERGIVRVINFPKNATKCP